MSLSLSTENMTHWLKNWTIQLFLESDIKRTVKWSGGKEKPNNPENDSKIDENEEACPSPSCEVTW